MASNLQRSSRGAAGRHNGCARTCALAWVVFVLVSLGAGQARCEEQPAAGDDGASVSAPADVGGPSAAGDEESGRIATWIERARSAIDSVATVSVRGRREWEGSEVFLSPALPAGGALAGARKRDAAGRLQLGLCMRGASRESVEHGQKPEPTIGVGLRLSFH